MVRATLVASFALLTGCVALGWRLGPGFSCRDPTLFAAPPVVVHDDGYRLTWTQGTTPFYFAPHYEPRDGRLVFTLVATASSGSSSGRTRSIPIEGDEAIAALRHGGAYWWEEGGDGDGRWVRLEVIEATPSR